MAHGQGKRQKALRAIEVTFRGMAPRDAIVYFVRRCASVRRIHGEALRASLQHSAADGFQVALELRTGGRTFRAVAMHAAAIVAVCRAFEELTSGLSSSLATGLSAAWLQPVS